MTDRTAPAAHPIAAPLAARWSPRSYEERAVPDAALAQVLEAARWAASCVNDQPWNYIVARKEKEAEGYAKIFSCLSPNNQGWAGRAPVLIASARRCAVIAWCSMATVSVYAASVRWGRLVTLHPIRVSCSIVRPKLSAIVLNFWLW